MRIRTEVTIERLRDDVFHRLADELDRIMPLICPLTNSVRLDSDKPIAAGTTGKIRRTTSFAMRAPAQASPWLPTRQRLGPAGSRAGTVGHSSATNGKTPSA